MVDGLHLHFKFLNNNTTNPIVTVCHCAEIYDFKIYSLIEKADLIINL